MPQIQTGLAAEDDARLRLIADRIVANEPALAATHVFGPRVSVGLTSGPGLFIGDHSEIALTSASDISILEYRILLLAGDGDLLVVGGNRHRAFEAYCCEGLGLGRVEVMTAAPLRSPRRAAMAQRCIEHGDVFERIVDRARESGHLVILPHMGTGSVWALAAAVARASKADIRVAAPPPRLTKRVNDKLWFAETTALVLGEHSIPPITRAYGPAALAANVAALAKRGNRVVVKVPDSAGSAGNISLASSDLIGRPISVLRAHLIRLLETLGWHGKFPLAVQLWDCAVVASPSVQVWVPELASGLPIVEGVFEQVVEGAAGEFVGAVPSGLPQNWMRRLAQEAAQLARLYQLIGYFGRCSFDAVLAGESLERATLHWIECNGRWGGVSMPMTLANRLGGNWREHPFVVVQQTHLRGRPMRFESALSCLRPLLYERAKHGDGVILLTPGGIESGHAVHLMAIADTVAKARGLAARACQALAS
ncbi:MAG: hypothetical protein GY789_17195 [Hyphomicrobiales bacterium]|nr:hypothetical protein [Hyphomicrobiales bacterium]